MIPQVKIFQNGPDRCFVSWCDGERELEHAEYMRNGGGIYRRFQGDQWMWIGAMAPGWDQFGLGEYMAAWFGVRTAKQRVVS